VQILVAVAVIQLRALMDVPWWLMTGVEQVSLPTAVAHGSVDREPSRNVTAPRQMGGSLDGEQEAGCQRSSTKGLMTVVITLLFT